MLETIMNYIDMNIVNIAIGLVLLMSGNILLGSTEAGLNGEFNLEKFIKGIVKAVAVALTLVLIYTAGVLNPEVIQIDLNGSSVNLVDGVNLLLTYWAWIYAKEVFKKLNNFTIAKIDIGEGM